MDKAWLQGHQVPIIDKGQIQGPPKDPFVQRNEELQGNMGTQEQSQPNVNNDPRKSELVEIPTTSDRVIYKIKAMFPFDLFPDELVIDEIKVSIIYKYFVSQEVNNILIKDITDIVFSSSFLFGSLRITGGEYQDTGTSGISENSPLVINRLRIAQAQIARSVILGLMIFSDQKVDTSQMTVEEIFNKTNELGKDR